MTLEQAKQLKRGSVIYDKMYQNADGTPARWKINGAVKLWKRSPERIQVPIKRGLYEFSYLTERNLAEFSLTEELK